MNQEQNNSNSNNFNTQGNNGIPNNQPLNNQNFNQSMGFNQQPINPQPQPTQNYQRPINQMNMQQSTPQPMNTFESGNANNQSFNNKPPKKMNLGLIIGIVAVVVVAIIITIFALSNKDSNVGSFGSGNNKTKLNAVVYVGGKNGNLVKTTNGTKWEKVNLPSNDKINSSELIVNGIEYINGEYILYARVQGKNGGSNNNTVLYKSTDGSTWELLTFTVSGSYSRNWLKLNYINNNYYVISQWGATATRQLYYGKDLHTTKNLFENDDLFKNWDAYVMDYAYGNNKFIVHVERSKKYFENADAKTKYFYVSTDGQNFEKNETDTALDAMEFGNNVFIGVSAFENYGIYKSDDGINWTKVFNLDKWSADYGIVYKDNNFYVWYDNCIYISSDGTNWKEFYKNADNQGIDNFDYKNGIFAYTSMYTEEDPKTYEYVHTFKTFISTDGKDWIESSFDYKDYEFSTIYILEK